MPAVNYPLGRFCTIPGDLLLHPLRAKVCPACPRMSTGGEKPGPGGALWEKRQFISSLTLQRSKQKAALMQRSRSMSFPHWNVMEVRTRCFLAEPRGAIGPPGIETAMEGLFIPILFTPDHKDLKDNSAELLGCSASCWEMSRGTWSAGRLSLV